MDETHGILLNAHLDGKLQITGEITWSNKECSSSTEYQWRVAPDNTKMYGQSYELLQNPSIPRVIVAPGRILRKFNVERVQENHVAFDLHSPSECIEVHLKVVA